MTRDIRKHVAAVIFSLLAAVSVAACGDDAGSRNSSAGTTIVEDDRTSSRADVPDACTFFSKDEIEAALGTRIQDGELEQAPENTSTCRFGGIANVTINTYATSESEFADFYELNSGDATTVNGLGDDAFVIGDVLLHVRVGDLAFSIRINDEQHQVDDVEQARVSLAESGVRKLQ